MASVRFFQEQIQFKLPNPRKTSRWLKNSILAEGKSLLEINIIFCPDDYLLDINRRYLNHTTLTDIVTFDNSDGSDFLAGDIFISIDRVKENASVFKVDFDTELHRVMIHGVLHLSGYSDKNSEQKIAMREKEDTYLSLR
jgi:rRNA maturation RNase YbeY